MIKITIDWLSFTTKETIEDETLLLLLDFNSAVPETPRFGYAVAHRFATGLVVMSNPGRDEMGRHWVLSGSCIQAIFDAHGLDCWGLLRAVSGVGAKITRLDVAKDAIDEKIDIKSTWRALQAGNYSGTIRSFSQVESGDGGHTLYIGSRASERFARIYDKAIQTGAEGDWKRFELELKGDIAKEAGRALVDPRNTPAQVFDGIAKSMCVIASPSYIRFFGAAEPVTLPKMQKQTDRETWIAEQVTRAVLNHLDEFPDSAATRTLYRALKHKYGEL